MEDFMADVRQWVDDFLNKIQAIPKENPSPYEFELFRVGSAHENLSEDGIPDFDVVLALGGDYVSENFTFIPVSNNRFKLQGKKPMTHLDSDGYLDALALRHDVFHTIARHINMISLDSPDMKIFYSMGESALTVQLVRFWKKPGVSLNIQIDLVPQIPVRNWKAIPGLLAVEEMPQCLRDSIERRDRDGNPIAFLSLGVIGKPSFSKLIDNSRLSLEEMPECLRKSVESREGDCKSYVFLPQGDFREYINNDRVFSISFSLLEKDFIDSQKLIRGIVKRLRINAKVQNWKGNYDFKSFHAKRIVMKYYDDLKDMKNAQEGFDRLLRRLANEVSIKGCIDGNFLQDQTLITIQPYRKREFHDDIMKSISPHMSQDTLRLL